MIKQIPAVYIDGEFIDSGERLESRDPSSGNVWAEIEVGGKAEIDAAIEAARAAFRERWSLLAPWERSAMLLRLADVVLDHRDEMAEVESTDNGKPIGATRGEIAASTNWLRFFAGAAQSVYGNTIPYGPGNEARTYRLPYGVVGAIMPWNSPVSLYMWKIAPALAAGNTLVLKPSELSSASASLLAKYTAEAGLPPGVLNVVAGEGKTPGLALASHQKLDKLTFTGSVATGKAVASIAAANFTPATIEAGGKAPLLVFADCDLEAAGNLALRGAFRSAGQSCAQISRILIERSVFQAFVETLAARARQIKIGPALATDTEMGPVITDASVARCTKYVDLARGLGLPILCGGSPTTVDGHPNGYYFQPTVIENRDAASPLFQDEIFGPVVMVQSFDDEEEAVALANGVSYGLTAAAFTSDLARGQRLQRDLQFGAVGMNSYAVSHWLLPYGGWKESGMGYDNGLEALQQNTHLKTVVVGG